MDTKLIFKDVIFTKLIKINHPKGDLFHVLKSSDKTFINFGEVYVTNVNYGERKGWKLHTKLISNLVVPLGKVKFFIADKNKTFMNTYIIGEENYGRLTIPSDYWVAFEGLSEKNNMIINVTNLEHDSSEALNLSNEYFEHLFEN